MAEVVICWFRPEVLDPNLTNLDGPAPAWGMFLSGANLSGGCGLAAGCYRLSSIVVKFLLQLHVMLIPESRWHRDGANR